LAVAEQTGLLAMLDEAVDLPPEGPDERLIRSQAKTRRKLLQTLLFMPVFGVFRPYALRSYSGDGLGLLIGRERAFGYQHTERFLSQLSRASFDTALEQSLAIWTSKLWSHSAETTYYVDGHRKPVYSQAVLPRGLIGKTGQILGCRALTLLHDEQGHPLLVSTARGDQHLTHGMPALIGRYQQANPDAHLKSIVVDREGMSGPFLHALAADHTVVTLLRSNQYKGLDDFEQVSPFTPHEVDGEGRVLTDIASARYALAVADQSEPLMLQAALIRDYRRRLPIPDADPLEDMSYWDLPWADWTDPDWQPSAVPPTPTQPRLIAVVATRPMDDAAQLIACYKRRWAAQENSFKDFLIPLGLDVNHGYGKSPVTHSELDKKRNTLQAKLERLGRWQRSAYARSQRASRRYNRLYQNLRDYTNTFAN
jgi:hypothetical protein